jgi:hypothetical protein
MPLLSQLLITVIITSTFLPQPSHVWYRLPPPSPRAIRFHPTFIHHWNQGLYPKLTRYRAPRQVTIHCSDKYHQLTTTQPRHPDAFIDEKHVFQDVLGPVFNPDETSVTQGPIRTKTENSRLLALLYTLSTPGNDRTYHLGTDVERICIDTGASACISTRKENFVTLSAITNVKINGIGSGLPVEGTGLLKWPIRDDKNNEIILYIQNALYVPKAPMGLLCQQQIAQQTNKPGDGLNALGHHGILTFDGFTRTVPYERGSKLPILYSIDGVQSYGTNMSHAASPMPPTTDNLTAKQKLLLRWHNRLSHMNFQKLQDLARIGALPKSILGCDLPLCCSCQLGKAHRRAPASDATKVPLNQMT